MQHKIFISDLKDGHSVESIFLVKLKSLQYARNGKPYLHIVLMDRTGEIACRIWENAPDFDEKFKSNDFVYVRGRVTMYQDKNQISITDIQPVGEDLINLSDFQPTSKREIGAMKDDLKALISSIGDPGLRKLLNLIFSSDGPGKKFFSAPAAKTIHHAFIGGLMEHSINVARAASKLKPLYPMVNFDIVITALLLHDIGKTKEIGFLRSFEYTSEGRLLGHIVIGVEIVDSFIRKIENFPEDLRLQILHILISHHGSLEFGSPKRPKTLEAIMVSYLDDMDSKLYGVHQFASKDTNLKNSDWTSYHKFHERYFYFPGEKGENPETGDQAHDNQREISANRLVSEVRRQLNEKETPDKKSQEDKTRKKDMKSEQETFDF